MKKRKKALITTIIIVIIVIVSQLARAAPFPSSFSSDADYYYHTGSFYWYGNNKSTYETGESWFTAKPVKPNTMYNSTWGDIQFDGYVENNGNAAFGFYSYDAYWTDGSAAKPGWNRTYKRYEKRVTAYYKRAKTSPALHNSSINGAPYVNGKDYWVKPWSTIDIVITGRQDWPGYANQELDDYVKNNYLMLSSNNTSKSYNYRYDNSINNYVVDSEVNIGFGARDFSEYVGDTYKQFSTTFKVQPKVDNKDMDVYGGQLSFNGKDPGWADTGKRIRTDGTPPSISNAWVENVTESGFDIVVSGLWDGRSGVKNIKFPTWTENSGQDDLNWYEQSSDGGTVRQHIDISSHKGEPGTYITHIYTEDNVGNSAMVKEIRVNVPKPKLLNKDGWFEETGYYSPSDEYWVKAGKSFVIAARSYANPAWDNYTPNRIYYSIKNLQGNYEYGAVQTNKENQLFYYRKSGDWIENDIPLVDKSFAQQSGATAYSRYRTLLENDNINISVYFTSSSDTWGYREADSWQYIGKVRSDGLAPISDKVEVKETNDINKFTVTAKNVRDTGSGLNEGTVKVIIWREGESYRKSYSMSKVANTNDYTFTVDLNIDEHKGRYGNFNFYVYSEDNVGNNGASGSSVFMREPPYNTKPTANFTVTPNPQLINAPLTYNDTSSANDPWDSIIAREWSYSSDGGKTWSNPTSTPQSSFSENGIYEIRLRVKDKGNDYSPGLWSDYVTRSVNIQHINLKAVSIDILDKNGEIVSDYLTQNQDYRAKVTIKNDGKVDVGAFNIGLYENNNLLSTSPSNPYNAASGLKSNALMVLYFDFKANNTGSRTFKLVVDDGNKINEVDESNSDNTKSIIKPVYTLNLLPTAVSIVGESDNVEVTSLQQNKKYRVKVVVTNNGQVDITDTFSVGVTEKDKSNTVSKISSDQNISGLKKGASATVYFPFVEVNRGESSIEAFVDNKEEVDESIEIDNKKSTVVNSFRKNLRADSIEIVGIDDDIPKKNLVQNMQYRAKLQFSNDGDTDITEAFDITLYENDKKISGSVNPARKTGIKKDGKETVYITFTAANRGTLDYKFVVDDKNEIYESDEADNSKDIVMINNRVNIKAITMDILDSNNNIQGYLIKGQSYKARVKIQNDGDEDLGEFNVGLYDADTKVSTLKVTGIGKGDSETYILNFVPSRTGVRSFTAFADESNIINESLETDNKVSLSIPTYDLELTNFRIVDMVNPPSSYTYPISIINMPVSVKSGYNVSFEIDAIGVADNISVEAFDSNGKYLGTYQMSRKRQQSSTQSVWGFDFATELDTPKGTIIIFKIKGYRGSFIYDFNAANMWEGSTLIINGSALEDASVNRIY